MFRRVVSLLLVLCLLLTQSAALGHAHGASCPAGHGTRPHIHVPTRAAPSGHHHHGPDGHHHHHGPAGHRDYHEGETDGPGAGTHPSHLPESPPDHDSDAVFLPDIDLGVGGRYAVEDERGCAGAWDALGLNTSATTWATPTREAACRALPPPRPPLQRPLYLLTLALLL